MSILKIDRRNPFHPAKFDDKSEKDEQNLARAYMLSKGGCPGSLRSWPIVSQDTHSLKIQSLETSQLVCRKALEDHEYFISQEEYLARLRKDDHIILDAKVLQTLWENQHLIPESWKEAGFIRFDGTVLMDWNGHLKVLYLWWSCNKWCWGDTMYEPNRMCSALLIEEKRNRNFPH